MSGIHRCPGIRKPKPEPLRAASVAIQELHKPVLVGTRDGEPVYRCMTCISIEVPCKTRSLADQALGEDCG